MVFSQIPQYLVSLEKPVYLQFQYHFLLVKHVKFVPLNQIDSSQEEFQRLFHLVIQAFQKQLRALLSLREGLQYTPLLSLLVQDVLS